MSEFQYILGKEKDYLLIDIAAGRIVYADDLLSKEKNKELARLLIEEELLFSHIPYRDDRAKRHPLHRIHVSKEHAFDAIKMLALQGALRGIKSGSFSIHLQK